MESQGRASIRFTLNGHRYELSRKDVEDNLAQVRPDTIRKHAVRINETWFPVIQAFEAATGVSRSEFVSHTARRHLASLGFEVAGDIQARSGPPNARTARKPPGVDAQTKNIREDQPQLPEEWHTEANVQSTLVTALASEGWRILSVANTATKERGTDVIAARDGQTVGIEVKGFPSRGYADPARAGERKRTAPSTQAGHWYSQAVLSAMRLRSREPTWRSVVALPDFARYRDLYSETAGSLAAAQIEVWWVDQTGSVQRQ
jgi:hypothetical protein